MDHRFAGMKVADRSMWASQMWDKNTQIWTGKK